MKTATVSLLLSALLTLTAQADLRYTVVTRVEGGPRGAPGNQAMTLTAAGNKARIDFQEGGMLQDGGYLISKDGGQTLLLVVPQDKTYMTWDMSALSGIMNALGPMMKLEVTNPKLETLLDEEGPALHGYPTRHAKFKVSYGMSMNIMGRSQTTTVQIDEEVWYTTAITDAALLNWFKQRPKISESMDKLIELQFQKVKGLPLKSIAVQTSTDAGGRATTVKTIQEVTQVQTLKADPAIFEIPAGFTELKPDAAEGAAGGLPGLKLPGLLKR